MLNEFTIVRDVVTIFMRAGAFCLIDLQDLSLAQSLPTSWQPHTVGKVTYAKGWPGKGKPTVYLHLLILPAIKGFVTDHRDTNGLNNRRYNLRHATKSLNGLNRVGPNTNSGTGVLGVTKTHRGTFVVRMKDGKSTARQTHSDLESAKRSAAVQRKGIA